MKKKILFILISVSVSLLILSCVPKSQYLELQTENEQLKKEIELLKQTDEYYYKVAIDKYQSKKYEESLKILNDILLKFPKTSLKKEIETMKVEINLEITKVYQEEKNNKNTVLLKAKKAESLQDSISVLKKYVAENHPDEFIKEVKSQLDLYTEKYEKEKHTIDLENRYGFKVIDYATGWRPDYSLLCPEIDLKLQCISKIKDYTKIKAVFKNTTKNEIFGEATEYLDPDDNSTKRKGDVFTVFIRSSVGYASVWDYPSMTVDIYLDDNYYKTYNIKKASFSGF